MNIIFFGTPSFAADILQDLLDSRHNIIGVVTQPDRPKGRGKKLTPPPVKEITPSNIPLFQPAKASTPETIEALSALNPDLFVVAAYGEIISQALLNVPPKGCINVHPSLLPKYRGATPIQRAIMNGDRETGTTIIEMVKKMDAGPMLGQETIPLPEDASFGELEKTLCPLSSKLLLEVLDQIEQGTETRTPQDEASVTFAAKISLEDREIDWTQSCETVQNTIRALSPRPGAFTTVTHNGQTLRLGIKRAKKELSQQGTPGQTLSYTKEEWIIACGSGALSLQEVQLEGKKSLQIKEFLRGYPGESFLIATK